jgi:hypothetical protein
MRRWCCAERLGRSLAKAGRSPALRGGEAITADFVYYRRKPDYTAADVEAFAETPEGALNAEMVLRKAAWA